MMNKIVSKLKQKGFRWFIWRLGRELRAPSIPLLKLVIDKYLQFKKKTLKNWSETREDDFLYAIYDLDENAITFNVVEILLDAEYEASVRNKVGFVMVFVPRSNDPSLTYEEYDALFDADNKLWKFQNIVLPVSLLSEKCKGAYLLPKRSDAVEFVKGRDVIPDLYDGVNLRGAVDGRELFKKLDRPNVFEGLRAPKQGMRYIQKWLLENNIKEPIVTITIRNFQFDKARNSNIEAWSQFVKYLRSAGYIPVVIPDTDTAFCEDQLFDEAILFKECAWNIGLRTSLYETAYLNFFVPNGCSQLAVFNPKCSYIMMNCLPAGSIVTTKESYERNDHPIGTNYRFATPNQRLCFNADTLENIMHEFERFIEDQRPQATNEISSHSPNTGLTSD